MESLATTVVAFVIVLGIIIFVHEAGHLVVAKAFGMKVFVFSFGFGKRLFGFKWGDTDCRVSLIPLGGYVKLEGEPDDFLSEDAATAAGGAAEDPSLEAVPLSDGTIVRVENPDYFTARPRWQRFLVYMAGPVMNAVLTVTVLTVFYLIGFDVDASRYDRPIVGAVDPASPGAAAGLRPGDELLAIDGRPQATWEDAQYHILLRPDRALELLVRRGEEQIRIEVRSESTSAERMGSIGVHPLVRIGRVLPGLPAEQAGLRPDDAILSIDGKAMRSFLEIPDIVGASGGKPLRLEVWREGRRREVTVTPRSESGSYRVGIYPKTVTKKFGPLGALREAARWTGDMTRQTGDVLWRLVTFQISPKTMMGPLGIAKASGDAARGGTGALFFLVAVISLQVGILNLFPLAPLDGGHMAILAGEGLLRRDFSVTVKTWIMNAGAMVIFLLIGLVVYSDLSKTSLFGFLP
jgi:regulator of sigma E protease